MAAGETQTGDSRAEGEEEEEGAVPSLLLLRRGSDARIDCVVMSMFHAINQVWQQDGVRFASFMVRARTYGCLPLGPDIALLEVVPSCKPLASVGQLRDTMNTRALEKMVASAAGAYTAVHVMGLTETDKEHLVVTGDGELVPVGFASALGQSAAHTFEFSVSPELKLVLGTHYWSLFVSCCLEAYLSLRRHAAFLVPYAQMLFAPFPKRIIHVKPALTQALLLNMDTGFATALVRRSLIHGATPQDDLGPRGVSFGTIK